MTGEGRLDPGPEPALNGADLRHALLTPVNHIIGYGEMLQEEAEESEQPEISEGARGLLSLGRDVLVLINRAVPPAGGACATAELADLQARLSAVIGQIVEHCEYVRQKVKDPADEMLSEDLGRVRAAAERLAEVVERRFGGPAPDAGRPAG